MKTPFLCFILGLVGISLFLTDIQMARADDGDWQQWTDVTWSQQVSQGLDTSLRWEGRMGSNFSKFSYYEVEPMLTWRYSPRWNFALGYEYDKTLSPTEEVMHAPSLNVTLKIPLRAWEVKNTFRAEYDIAETSSQDSTFMYRHRTDVQTRWRWGSKELIPYLSEEWFLEARRADIVQNRLSIGMNIPIIPHWIAGIYFMRYDEQTASGWQWHPVLGVQVLAQF